MKTKLLLKKPKKYILLFSALLLLSASAIPYFAGTGLDNPEPMGSYLNANFPAILPQGLPYEPVYPNISFNSPLTFNELPNGNKIIVGQRDGRIFWFDKTPNVAVKNSFIDLSDKVGVVWDGGFLGLTLHPNFGTPGNNYFYVYYTTEDANSNDFPNSYTTQSCDSEEYWGNFLVLARYEANPNTLAVQESSEQVMLKLRMYGTTHRGGGLLFGDDGFLYLTTGDQTAFKKSQDILNNLDGGVLRMDVDKDPSKSHVPIRNMPDDHGFSDELTGNGYWIPNDNPFLSPTGVNFEEYYSMGHRNPHRMTKDRATGKLYVGEIGGGRHEEINIVKKGGNFGWPLYEGFYRNEFCVQSLYNNMTHEQPLLAFPRAEANAIIGGYVYRGNEVPELQGKYICADYGSGEEIFTVDINTGAYEQYGNFTSTNIISFGEDKQGELYILKQGTSPLFKVTSKNSGFGNTPQLLSETGAFTNLTNLTPVDGLVPYDLVESFWSDGAEKKRWMAIPNNGSHNTAAEKIGYSDVDDWDFPVGSVLVKHFELPVNANNPAITKRLETRFSIKASDGNFYFVTYKWNDQQTDAVLLTSGLDESISITEANGSTSTQTWSYPSTIDCVSCHNPTTGGVLGAKTRHLNKDFTYSETGRTANQLVTLSHLGILDQSITDASTTNLLTSKAMNDASASLDDKARSYLDLNCAYCHRPGTGNRGDFDLRLNLDMVQTGLLDASPYLPLGIPNEKIVAAGSPATSILYHRMNSIDPAIRMPPIAKNKIDASAVQLIDDWITQLNPDPCSDRIIMETFVNVPGTTIAQLKSNTNFPNTPSQVDELNEFRIPINARDNYGVRVKGLLKAPETGTYYFWVTGDDNVELNISSNDNQANAIRIAYHENWSFDGEWDKYPTQKSAGINLVAGQNYYLEALMNEGGGGDNLSVGWRKPSNGNGAEPFQVLPCTAFDTFSGPQVIKVTGVSSSPNSVTVVEGETQQLTATISPSNATDTGVIWSTSNQNIASVSANGLVTAVANGNAVVTVTSNDGGFQATSSITVTATTIDVTGVSLAVNSLSLEEGSQQQLIATVSPSNADNTGVTWQSSNTTIANVNADGLITGVAAGTATITVTTNDGSFTDESTITVTQAPIGVCTDRIIMEVYDNVSGFSISDLEFNPNYPDAPSSTSNLDQMSIPYNTGDNYGVRVKGLLKAPETGTYYFWITGDDNVELSLSTDENRSNLSRIAYHTGWSNWNEWNKYPTQKSVAISLEAGKNYYIEALMNEHIGSDLLSVGWRKPSDGNGADPDELISCDDFDTFSTVQVDVTGVNVSPSTILMQTGQTNALNANVSPSNASNRSVTWSSSNTAVATVSAGGVVNAISEGTTSITAQTNDGGFTSSSTVEVIDNGNGTCSNRIVMETYANVPGFSIAQLENSTNFPNAPSATTSLESFVIPYNGGDNYGVRVKGLLKAPETGTYYFWITGDDNVELNLSTDNRSSNKVRIAYHDRWSNWNEWNKYPTQKSVGIDLVAGQNYYIEGLMNELGGSDYLAVGWRKPSDGIGDEPAELIPCEVFDTFIQALALRSKSLPLLSEVVPGMVISPNPATSEAWVSVGHIDINAEVTYEVYNMIGQRLIAIRSGTEVILDINELPPGVYFLIATSGEWSERKKLIVK
ncbi:MAG: Ig-like domain-containing protein [Maribacter sp.]